MPSLVIIQFLDVLAVVALAVGQAEQPLLQDRVAAVPQRDAQAPAQVVSLKPPIPSSPQR